MSATTASGRKAEYICPECGHRSPPTGDWRVTEGRRRDYHSPDCGHRVLSQPTFGDRVPSARMQRAGRRLCAATARVATATATVLGGSSVMPGTDRST